MKKSQLPPLAQINITSLVDVTIILLIIFMITAPLMRGGVEVKLPRSASTPENIREGILVTITKEGEIFLDDQKVPKLEFRGRLIESIFQDQYNAVYLQADREVPYGEVVEVIGQVKDAGIENVGLVAEPLEKKEGE